MSYIVTNSNAYKFTVNGESMALGVVQDDFGMYNFGILHQVDGAWNLVTPVICDNLLNDTIMAYGSVANYILAQLPVASKLLRNYAQSIKPSVDNKPACVGYDMALDVQVDPVTMEFTLNKIPPLSHAR